MISPRAREIADVVAPLSGTAAQILCIFFLAVRGQSFTNKELALMLGKSENTISTAVQQLTFRGLLQHNGKNNGCSLISEYFQPPLMDTETEKLIQKNLDQLGVNPKKFGSTPLISSSSDPTYVEEDQLPLTTSADNPRKFGSSPVAEPENTVLDTSDPETTEVRNWLIRAGIAPGSPKMKLLLEKRIPLEATKAHVLEHLSQVEAWERDPKGRQPGTGLLIYHLEHGYPVPPMRCEECLRPTPCYCSVIKR